MLKQLKNALGTHFETKDHHEQSMLKTQYFKSTKDRLIKGCKEVIQADPELKIIAESAERGEISVQLLGKKKGLLVISIISVSPLKTAVDFSLTIDNGLNFGFAEARIQKFYKKLSDTFPVVSQN